MLSLAAASFLGAAPSGTYKGSKSILGQHVDATITVGDSTHADITIKGPINLACKAEDYKYDGASSITLPNKDTTGDCVHDALQANKASISKIKYDASADTVTVTAKYIININIVLSKSGDLLSIGPSDEEKAGWFLDFEKHYGRMYDEEERGFRFSTFMDNLGTITSRNLDGHLGQHYITQFSDLTQEEFSARYTNYQPKASLFGTVELDIPPSASAASKDWRGSKLVTAVKDQGQCGSCWAFSATEQIESDVARETGKLLTLSPQQITSCDRSDGGCQGGNTETAYNYVKSAGGLETESSYPYTSGHTKKTGTCRASKSEAKATVSGYSTVSSKGSSESKMLTQIQKSPMSVCVDASKWQSYHGGVLGSSCGTSLDHCVQAVGYNSAENYWIVRNSWGKGWGNNGFVYVQQGMDACGIAKDVTITKGAKLV